MHKITIIVTLMLSLAFAACSNNQAKAPSSTAASDVDIKEGRVYVAELFARDMVGNGILQFLDDFHEDTGIDYAAICRNGSYLREILVDPADAQEALDYFERNAPDGIVVGFLGWPNHPLQLTSNARE
jgi:hypothetical protein